MFKEREDYPILEFPGNGPAVIEPCLIYGGKKRIPRRCVITFFKDVIDELKSSGRLSLIYKLKGEGDPIEVFLLRSDGGRSDGGRSDGGRSQGVQSESLDDLSELSSVPLVDEYGHEPGDEFTRTDRGTERGHGIGTEHRRECGSADKNADKSTSEEAVALVFPGIGAPFASCTLEELICLGADKFICCGGAGVLNADVEPGTVIVPTKALRDEGTSYHYQEGGRYSEPSHEALVAIEKTLSVNGVSFLKGKTWTTDAVFRETAQKVKKRREEGCLTVEMEAAALFAVARFRGVVLGQILYGGDDVSGIKWDTRGWMGLSSLRSQLIKMSVEAVRRIGEKGGNKLSTISN
jgi:uridine phosphorylase